MNTFKLFLLLATILSFVTAKDNEKKNQKQQNKNKNKCGGKSCQTSKGGML